MFCTNCGAKVDDGAAFCHQCGAKLFAGPNTGAQEPERISLSKPAPAPSPSPAPVQTAPAPEKKRSPGPLIAVIAVLVVAVIAVAAFLLLRDSGGKDSAPEDEDRFEDEVLDDEDEDEPEDEPGDEPEKIALSQPYESGADGFSFRCPADWTEEEPADAATLLSVSVGDSMGAYARVTVTRADDDGTLSDATAADFETSYLNSGLRSVESIDLLEVELDGRPARKVVSTIVNSEDVSIRAQQYIYLAGPYAYFVTCMVASEYAGEYLPVVDAIMDSYTITAPEPSGPPAAPDAISDDVTYAVWEAYLAKCSELAEENDQYRYSLIDLTGSGIPALVADMPGYYVSVYLWADGETVPVMDYWPYGAGGNAGYDYLPGENVIRNFNSDLAGAIVYESYMRVNADYEVESILDDSLTCWYFRDLNGNYSIDEGEPIMEEDPIYYYGDMEIPPQVYASYQISGEYEMITGELYGSDFLAQLNMYWAAGIRFSDLEIYGGEY